MDLNFFERSRYKITFLYACNSSLIALDQPKSSFTGHNKTSYRDLNSESVCICHGMVSAWVCVGTCRFGLKQVPQVFLQAYHMKRGLMLQ